MITPGSLTLAGKFNKPHGIKGEISATMFLDDMEPDDLRCLFVEMDGIPVPFFITGSRPKSSETWLLTIDGIDTEEEAREMVNKEFFALTDELPGGESLSQDADGFYAEDLVGFEIFDSEAGNLGRVSDINDQTENVLFIVTRPDGSELLIPVVDEFIIEIDIPGRRLLTSVPAAILDLNS
ncbi:MAG: 16S rRNA processing protein RimM [Duncaniella sp.]|nr:16S rRNA processing protein RimM [Duncaniella sp.]